MGLKSIVVALVLIISLPAWSQTKTTEGLQKEHPGSLAFYFYNNTLRMLNQKEDPGFDELIKDIEKMKFLVIDKEGQKFGPSDYKKLTSSYKAEAFEEIMTSRFEGRNFDVFLKEKNGKTQGMIVTVNDSSSLYVLDIVGSIALNKVTSLFNTIDGSSDVAEKLREMAKKD
jgi:hypothetical protein